MLFMCQATVPITGAIGHDLSHGQSPHAVEKDVRLIKNRAVVGTEKGERVVANAAPATTDVCQR
jgi:hypothetical protein